MPASEQWDLIYPAWKPWLARQLAALGVPEQSAASVVEADIHNNVSKVWEQVPREKRPHVESVFAALLPAVKQNRTLYKETAAAWLALVAEDKAANARAQKVLPGEARRRRRSE